jgi:cytochrome c peroxidase
MRRLSFLRVGSVAVVLLGTAPWIAGCPGPIGGGRSGNTTVGDPPAIDPTRLDNYARPDLPAHYRDPAVAALDQTRHLPVTNAGATLGRVLFFDRTLSVNDSLACASCHLPQLGFGDTARFSLGHDGKRRTTRHSMRLANARFYDGPGFFWDRRAPTLEAQVTEVIVNPIEFGFDGQRGGVDSLVRKLRRVPWYPPLFALAFGDSGVTAERLRSALGQFVRSIVSTDSKWDRGYATVYDAARPARSLLVDLPNFTVEENRGRRIFMRTRAEGGAGCASCHVPPTFSMSAGAMSNGMDLGETRIFKAPSLKNVALTPPYMHEGRLISPFQVAAYYNRFVQPGPALDPRLHGENGGQLDLRLSDEDQLALAAFLMTLTDSTLLSDPRFRDPFREPRSTAARSPNR